MEHGKNEERSQPASRRPERRRRRGITVGGVIGRFFLTIFTLALIGVCTACIFAVIFMRYVETSVAPTLAISLKDFAVDQSSIIYYHDDAVAENDGWVEYKTVHGVENRILVDIKDIPDAMWQAAVAIEDERFFTHHGVDWKRTLHAVMTFFTNESTFGASTITQQVLRNKTEDKEVTINRKIREIFRALEFEKNTTKMQILEEYLNTIYLGEGCGGVQTAAQFYFGKDVSELSVAECASIIAITNNPSMYSPTSPTLVKRRNGTVSTAKEMNKYRQGLILDKMTEVCDPDTGLPYLTKAQAAAAKAEVLHFSDGSADAKDIVAEANSGMEVDNWFVEQVKTDVAKALMAKYDVGENFARNLINKSGYKIYATVDPRVQEIAESIYEDRSNLDVTSPDGKQQIQSGITIVDTHTGNVVAIVGAIGKKEADRLTNFATMKNQVGSSIKPLTCYAPALEAGIITPGSTYDNYPVELLNGSPWPKNAPNDYTGWTTIREGVRRSWNTIAVQTLTDLGLAESYAFATEKLNLDLVLDDMNRSPLGMGGLTYGLSTVEMAAAFAALGNNGVYNAPRTYYRVEDSEGNIILENDSATHVAMKDTTAYLMTDMLLEAVKTGTGKPARFDNMTIAGKTGTTNDNFIRYFAGYTPYYSAAVWVGYQYNAKIVYSGNPAVDMWKKVMEKVHEGLENRSFDKPDGLTTVELCLDSGKRCTDACRADLRGSRARSYTVASGTAPAEECTLHTLVDYCAEGECLAGEFCPEESVKQVGVLDYERVDYGPSISAFDDGYLLSNMQKAVAVKEDGTGGCPAHTEALPEDPLNPDDDPLNFPGGVDPENPGTDVPVTPPDTAAPPDTPSDPANETPDPPTPPSSTEPAEPDTPTNPDGNWWAGLWPGDGGT